ncbi:MAG: acyl-CoA dehydrogenase family protein [Acetobacteraceae bacterium]|nr:acyl-CoA dehydrogenase family protein [Acetobacteraceae bacterium]
MTYAAGQAEPNDSPILCAAIALAPKIKMAADEIERERQLPRSIVDGLRQAGVFGMAMPRAWDGPELDPLTQFRVLETLAMADGSVGWCAMINCDGGYMTAFLDDGVGRGLYPDLQLGTASALTPTGQAVRVPGGYRVSGRFPFVSGCLHCEWVWLGCVVLSSGTPVVDGNGVPETRQCLVRLSQCEVLDTWYTTGLRGTGSNDLLAKDVFVEAERTFSFQDKDLIKRPGPLYAFPFMFRAKSGAVALGIARHALDSLVEIATSKAARRYRVGEHLEPARMMRDDVFIQQAVGRADSMLTSARGYLFEVMSDFWSTLVAGGLPSATQAARFATMHAFVVGMCVEVVQHIFKAAGGTAIYQKGPLDRCLRDVLTANQHVSGSARAYETAGRLLLGMEPLRGLH